MTNNREKLAIGEDRDRIYSISLWLRRMLSQKGTFVAVLSPPYLVWLENELKKRKFIYIITKCNIVNPSKFFHIGDTYQLLNFLGYDGICNLYYVEKVHESSDTTTHELYLLREFIVEKFPSIRHCEKFWEMEEQCSALLKDSPYTQFTLNHLKNIKFETLEGRIQFYSLYEYPPLISSLKDWFLRDTHALNMDIRDIINDLIIPVCQLMEEAHAKGIIHRDLNFSSLFVQAKKDTQDLTTVEEKITFIPIISTWRTACIRSYEEISKIPTTIDDLEDGGEVIRTPGFFAPEIAMGKKAGIFSDIYEMGAILYFLASNGAIRSREEAVEDFILDAAEKNQEIEAELNCIIKRCTQFEPNLRYKSFADLIQDLNAFVTKQYQILEYLKRYKYANLMNIGLIFQIPTSNFTGFVPFSMDKMIHEDNGYFRIGQQLFSEISEISSMAPLEQDMEQFVISYSNNQDIFVLYEGRHESATLIDGNELIPRERIPYQLGQSITVKNLSDVTFSIGEKPVCIKTLRLD